MELPKNITQIGESDKNCKIYVEDYCISYIKQENRQAENKPIAVALYGIRKEENGISYLFFYGTAKLSTLQKEVKHLSQAQNLEIDKLRKLHFPGYEFLGYRILNGEMVEGFQICEQGICRLVNGYACFYEKNDSMLAYMIKSRKEEVPPEEVNQEKYDQVKQRQEERRIQNQDEHKSRTSKLETFRQSKYKRPERQLVSRKEKAAAPTNSLRLMRIAVGGVFALLCIAGLATMNNGEGIQATLSQFFEEFTEQKIPDAGDAVDAINSSEATTLITDDKLTEALQKENVATDETSEPAAIDGQAAVGEEIKPDGSTEESPSEDNGQSQEAVGTEPENNSTGQEPETVPPEADNTNASNENASEEAAAEAASPVAYVIQKGDTLIGISIRQYGTKDRVNEICELNNISNPDDIKVGQKILLP